MKKTITLAAFVAMTVASQAALTLTNTDFEGGISTGNTPTGWTEIAANHAGSFYANVTDASGGTNHNLYMQGRGSGNIIQQSFTGGTADTQGSITISLDAGWRNDPGAGETYSWDLQIFNVTDAVVLDTETYTLTDDNLGGAPNDPRTIDTAKSFTFTYDN